MSADVETTVSPIDLRGFHAWNLARDRRYREESERVKRDAEGRPPPDLESGTWLREMRELNGARDRDRREVESSPSWPIVGAHLVSCVWTLDRSPLSFEVVIDDGWLIRGSGTDRLAIKLAVFERAAEVITRVEECP